MRKFALALALGLALTGCAGSGQVDTSTSPTLITPSVNVAVTAVRLAQDHGLDGVVSQEASLYSLSAAAYGNVEYMTYDNGDPATVLADTRIDTYVSREARDAFLEFANAQGQYTVGGETDGTFWTVTQDQGGPETVQQVAGALGG